MRMFHKASLISHRALGGISLDSSIDAGWRSVMLHRIRWSPEPAYWEGQPTPDVRLMVALRGSQHVEVFKDGHWHVADLRPGALGLTPSGHADRLRTHGELPFEAASLCLPATLMEEAADRLLQGGQRSGKRVLSQLSFVDPAIAASVGALLAGMRSGAPDLYAEQAAHWLATHLLVVHGHADPDRAAPPSERLTARSLERVIELMRSHYADALSLEALASEACISKFHFSRLFRARTGMPPHEFLVAERMKAARRLLMDTDLPIGDIAARVGYRTIVQFGVAFKRAHGTTATAYRARERG